ncbi:hypothetical protein HDU76_013837, partial [Blyttiomyces sp. JEL0837]
MASSGSSSVFDSYISELDTLSESLEDTIAKLSDDKTSGSSENRKLLVNLGKRSLEEADEMIGQIEIELRTLPIPTRTKLTPILKQRKDTLANQRKAFAQVQSDRYQLLGNRSTVIDFDNADLDQRTRLLRNTERLEESGRRLTDIQRIALET